jgi:hypothetical protein
MLNPVHFSISLAPFLNSRRWSTLGWSSYQRVESPCSSLSGHKLCGTHRTRLWSDSTTPARNTVVESSVPSGPEKYNSAEADNCPELWDFVTIFNTNVLSGPSYIGTLVIQVCLKVFHVILPIKLDPWWSQSWTSPVRQRTQVTLSRKWE